MVNDCLTQAPLFDKQENDSLSQWVKAWLKVNLQWSRKIQLVNWLCSLAWLDGRWEVEFCSLWLLGSVWTVQLRCLLLTPRLLFLRGFCRSFALNTFLVTFCLTLWGMVKNSLCQHAGKWLAYVTHNCHSIMHLPEVDRNCFGVPAQL